MPAKLRFDNWHDRTSTPAPQKCPLRRPGKTASCSLAVIVMVALILLALAVAAPVVARDLRRDKEVESIHRAQQYVRAIQLYQRQCKFPTLSRLRWKPSKSPTTSASFASSRSTPSPAKPTGASSTILRPR